MTRRLPTRRTILFVCALAIGVSAPAVLVRAQSVHVDSTPEVPATAAAGIRPLPSSGSQGRSAPPLVFERNAGQVADDVRFLTRAPGYQLFFTADGATWALQRGGTGVSRADDGVPAPLPRGADAPPVVDVLRMRLVGARRDAVIEGTDRQSALAHYFRGSDPARWHTNVPTFARVTYRALYPGVDLVFYGRQTELEYDFHLAPGADPEAIALAFDGALRVGVDAAGSLVLDTPGGRLIQRQPVAFQDADGRRQPVDVRYEVADGRVRFAVGDYDRTAPLVIDPVLAYSSFLGGSGGSYGEQAYGTAVDAADNLYLTGKTTSTIFPVGTGYPASNDAFVVKVSPSGAIQYVAIIGGGSSDSGEGIAVDPAGRAVIAGFTDSTNFPTLNPIQLNRSGRDAFAVKLDQSGQLVYATYLGGSHSVEYGEAVALDPAGNAYVAGTTKSPDFPILNGFQTTLQNQDAFVVKIGPSGTLLYSTYLGGSGADVAESITVDASGSFYVTGWTASGNFPQVNAPQGKGGGEDVYLTRFSPDGSALVFSRFLGGNADERALAVVLDGAGGAYVGGFTNSTNFPLLLAAQADQPGTDAFVCRVNGAGALLFSTYLGGNAYERVLGLSVRDGRVFVTGQTFSTNFLTANAVQSALGGDGTQPDAFVTAFDVASSALLYSTYLGGSGVEEGRGVAALPGANVFVVGWTESVDYPTVRPEQNFKSNVGNAFIARIAPVGVDTVSPAYVQAAGGTSIAVGGSAFAAGASVLVNGVAATSVVVQNASSLTAVTPALPTGPAAITVRNTDGMSGTLYDAVVVLNGSGPVADAGPDQTLTATGPTTPVTLDGSASFDPDHDPLTFQWRDAANALLGTGAIVQVSLPVGVNTIQLTVSDGHSTPGQDTVVVTIADTVAPVVTVVSPDGGNKIYTGTPAILEWSASDVGSGTAGFDVYLSTDGGTTYGTSPICAAVPGTARRCTWNAPAPATTSARIRVTGRDAAGNVTSDTSNKNFSIIAGTASITVTAPNTALNWGAGSTQQIAWKHNLGSSAHVRLDVSYDGGGSWSTIADDVKNSAGSKGVYNWTVPNVLSTTCRVRVTWNHGPVSDQSNANFTVAPAFVALNGPAAGTSWAYGTTQTQKWTTNLGAADRVDVLLSTDGGGTFPTTLVANAKAPAGSVKFTVPTLPQPTSTAQTRVRWSNAPSGFSAQATSPSFTIEGPYLALASPNGGNMLKVGRKTTITWAQNLGPAERVRIALSQDDGATYPILVLASTPSDGRQTVKVPASWATADGRILVSWVDDETVSDESDASFVVQ